eukprot:SAG31_NODE_1509_length_8062_cov_6.974884_7_plen_329_part_00
MIAADSCNMMRVATQWIRQSLAELSASATGTSDGQGAVLVDQDKPKAALIVLNTPQPAGLLQQVWARSTLRVVADGGANRLSVAAPDLVPDVVVGDLDSANPDTIARYARAGCEVLDQSNDQDTTDLEKALTIVRNRFGSDSSKRGRVYVLGQCVGVDGRLDHYFATLNAMFKFQDLQIIVVGADSALSLLPESAAPTTHILTAVVGCHCGLVPIGRPCRAVSTNGLEWNMEKAPMEYGGLISCCNIAAATQVEVTTADPLLWMLAFDAELAASGNTEGEVGLLTGGNGQASSFGQSVKDQELCKWTSVVATAGVVASVLVANVGMLG